MVRPDRLIVGIEDEAERLVENAIAPGVGNQNERFEEPRRVRAMPLGRAGIRHGLDGLVLSREWSGQSLGETPDVPIVSRDLTPSIADRGRGLCEHRPIVSHECSVLIAHTCLPDC